MLLPTWLSVLSVHQMQMVFRIFKYPVVNNVSAPIYIHQSVRHIIHPELHALFVILMPKILKL